MALRTQLSHATRAAQQHTSPDAEVACGWPGAELGVGAILTVPAARLQKQQLTREVERLQAALVEARSRPRADQGQPELEALVTMLRENQR